MVSTTTNCSPELNRILAAGQLPALPQSAIRLLELSKDPENGPGEFAVPIESDPGLTGQVLRFVNSSYFGLSREISSVKLAITLVGIRTIKNFVLWSAVFSLMPNPRCGMFNLTSLWQDSLRRALFARFTARLLGLREAEEPFAAALLQDMAVPLLVKELPDDYSRLLAGRESGRTRLSDLEQERFGWHHGEVGGQMARRWNLPETTAQLIERHTRIEQLTAAGKEVPPDEVAVALSSLLPAVSDGAWFGCEQFERYYTALCPPSAPGVCETLAAIDVEFAEFAPVMKVAAPPKTLVDSYREAITAAL